MTTSVHAAAIVGPTAVTRSTESLIVLVVTTWGSTATTVCICTGARGILVWVVVAPRTGSGQYNGLATGSCSCGSRGGDGSILPGAGIVGIGRRRRCCLDRLAIGVDVNHLLLLLMGLMRLASLMMRWGRAGMVLDGGVAVPMRRRWRRRSNGHAILGMCGRRLRSIDVNGLGLAVGTLGVVHRRLLLWLLLWLSRLSVLTRTSNR